MVRSFVHARRLAILVPATILLLCGSTSAQEGGIEVFAASTLFDQGTRVSVSHIYKRKGTLYQGDDDISDPMDRTFEEHRIVAAVDHGVRPDLTLSMLLPVVTKTLDSNAGDLDSTGFGDAAVLAKFRAYKRDWKRGSFNLSAIGGLEIPTGDTSVRDGGARLAPGMQPGLGAWNPFVGIAVGASHDRVRFDGLAFFKTNTEGAQDFEKGDFVSIEANAAYRFLHRKYPGPTAKVKVGIQWRHELRSKMDGVTVVNSGSEELRLRSGLSWHPAPNIDVSLGVEVPLHQDLDGTQLGLDYRTVLGIGMRF